MSINREEIKKKLLARKNDLEEQLRNLAQDRASTESDQVQDPLDQAIKSGLEDINISLEENQRDEYQRIVNALTMLDKGTYGTCADCELSISEKRLALYPNATRCISCQENREMSS